MNKFKKGQRVLVRKPKQFSHNTDGYGWCESMDIYDKTIQIVQDYLNGYYGLVNNGYYYHQDWLIPVGRLGEALYGD